MSEHLIASIPKSRKANMIEINRMVIRCPFDLLLNLLARYQ